MTYDPAQAVACKRCGCTNPGADKDVAAAAIAPVCARMDCPKAIGLARASTKLFMAVPKHPGSLFAPNREGMSKLVVVGKTKGHV